MRKKVPSGILAIVLSVSMAAGTVSAAGSFTAAETSENSVSAVRSEDQVWDLTSDNTSVRPVLQGTSGEFDGIQIDAVNGKFAPRAGDTQINQGTVLGVPVAANSSGAVLHITLSGGTAEVQINGTNCTDVNKEISFELPASDSDTVCQVAFVSPSAYVATVSVTYKEAEPEYPGTPESISAEDVEYTFETAQGLLDENGNAPADNKLEGNRGTFSGMKVDAVSGKFNIQPEQKRAVINAGTVLYIPVAYDAKGAVLLIAGTQDGHTPSNLKINGAEYTTNTEFSLDMDNEEAYPQYLKVEFDTICYATSLSVNYASDSDYGIPEVDAKDKTWDFTESSPVERPLVQGGKGEFDGIQIDATTGKFAPRTSDAGGNDTQIAAGTTLYIPVAPDAQGASVLVSGNNYNNLTVSLDGTELTVGKEMPLPAVEENTYLPLEFSSSDGTGSCYLTGITVDYMSDSAASANIVSVGAGNSYDYTTIQAALDANSSSASNPLVLLIAPGTYTEKVTVDKPWVSFQPLYRNGGKIVIEESYYSSNTFYPDGTFHPQDDYDFGTDKCGTVLLTANATGFSASGITFQNSYNVVDHTGKGEQTPAVAFGSAADKVYLKDCSFIGRQDTLYLHGSGSRVQVENCYIEGTVDFVFGDAEAYFTGCRLHMAGFTGRNTGYFTAANTKKGNSGLVFSNCTLTVDSSYGKNGQVSLGRPWQTEIYTETVRNDDGSSYIVSYDKDRKNPDYENTSSAVTFIGCSMDPAIQDSRWNVWTRKDKNGKTIDVTYHDDVRFTEINSMDLSGNYLDPEDYTDIVLGTMLRTDDVQAVLEDILGNMGFGSGVGNWMPSFTDYSETLPENNSAAVPGNGGSSSQGAYESGTSHADGTADTPVKTGDTSVPAVWAVLMLAAGACAAAVLAIRRKTSR